MDRSDPGAATGAELAVVDGGAVLKRSDDELGDLSDQIGKRMLSVADIAIQHFADPAEEMAKLDERTRRIAIMASQSKSDAPVALLAALDYHKEIKRRAQASREGGENIFIQNNFGVELPAQRPPPSDAEVVIIDADKLRETE